MNIQSLNDLSKELKRNQQLQDDFRQDPVSAIEQIKNPLDEDRLIYRIVVAALGLTVVVIVIGIVVLMATTIVKEDKNIPTILTAIGSTSIGALSGLLAPSPRRT